MSNELEHFGVKGMKWGIRKDRRNTGNRRVSRGGSSGPVSSGSKKATERDEKNRKATTDRNSPEYKAKIRKRGMVAAGTVMATAGLFGYGVVAKRSRERSVEKSIVSELVRLQKDLNTQDGGKGIGPGMAKYGSSIAYENAIRTIRNRKRSGVRSAEKSIVSELVRLQKDLNTQDGGKGIGPGMAKYGSSIAYENAIRTIRNRKRR